MNRFKGTPAPWVVDDNGVYFEIKEDGHYSHLADICGSQIIYDEGMHKKDGVAYANACLIASAPELLDALIEMQRNGRKQGWNDKYESSMEKTRLAIAKALGEVK